MLPTRPRILWSGVASLTTDTRPQRPNPPARGPASTHVHRVQHNTLTARRGRDLAVLDGLDIGDEKRRLLDEFTDRWPWETVERSYAVRRLVTITPDRHRDDIRQVAAIAAWRAVESWDPAQRPLISWCHFKGHYAAFDALRALYRDEPPTELGDEQFSTHGDPDTAAEGYSADEILDQLRSIPGLVTERHLRVLKLITTDKDWSQKAIAVHYGVTESAISQTLRDLRNRLTPDVLKRLPALTER